MRCCSVLDPPTGLPSWIIIRLLLLPALVLLLVLTLALLLLQVAAQFKTQLGQLMTQLHTMAPHYVRCIKPNPANRPLLLVRLHFCRC